MSDRSANPFGSRLLGSADQPTPILRIRVQVLLTVLLMVTNVVGAAVVFALLVLVIPGPRPAALTLTAVTVAGPAYVVFGLVLGGWWGTRRALRALRWALAERVPSAAERAEALRVPRELTVVQAVLWAGGVLVAAVLLGVVQPSLLVTVPATIGLTGVVVCANAYLLGQFVLRPVAARALADDLPDRRPGGVGTRMLVFWCLGTGVPTAGLIGFALLVLSRGGVTADRLAVTVVVLGGVVLVFGSLVTVFTVRAIVPPLGSVRDAMAQVRQGEWDVEVPVYDATELGLLQAGFNRMARGLRERERIRDLFGRHVGQEVAAAALDTGLGEVTLGGTVCEVSVLFVDLVGSTALAATRPPTEVVSLLNRFFALIVDEIDTRGGLVNKFVGDAVLAVFGAPVPLPDHATRALAAARAIARRLPGEIPDAVAGVGVAGGRVVAGNVGERRRFEYTVIGDPVNEAARLTELAKTEPHHVVASLSALRLAGAQEAALWKESRTVTLRGRAEATTIAVPRAPAPAVDQSPVAG
ncbi:adenylate/guanylate cyclase domain-containing protein [Amycolatopsis pigmentata]|uniref:Adenylate/guanylate cyclase domain-containing protein n=1 Tax=Amycolatopsis pigmentata TaxID=450801 RepID=A0ABW5G0G2_9PSEU